jgi:hypothetical protein
MDYQEIAVRLRNLENKEVGVGALLEEIERAEQKLGVRLPNSYKTFLREFGWAAVGPYEVYGLGSNVPSHLHLIEIAKNDQHDWDIPLYLVPFYNDGASNIDCFDTRRFEDEECPVVVWYHELGASQEPQDSHENFISWLAEHIEWASNFESG